MENTEELTESTSPRVIQVMVNLYPEDRAFLDQYATALGIHNRSAALRFLLRDWARVTGQVYPTEVKA